MKITELVRKVEADPVFQLPSHHYLVHIFTTVAVKDGIITVAPPELGYYNAALDKIIVVKTDPVSVMQPEEVFKEHGKLQELVLSDNVLDLQQAAERAEVLRAEHFPRHPSLRMICILQQRDSMMWNITIVSMTLQMIILRIDALTGALINSEIHPLMSLSKE